MTLLSPEDEDKRHAHAYNSRLTSNPTIGVYQPDRKKKVYELTDSNSSHNNAIKII